MILFLAVAGIGLTIGAASAVMVFNENLQVDNLMGDSEVEINSNTGDSKLTLRDQGLKRYALVNEDGSKKFLVNDDSKGKTRISVRDNGKVGIGFVTPTEKLHVAGNIKASGGMVIDGDTLVVDKDNNRVGIGTPNPSTKLHVVGDLTLNSDIHCGTGCVDSADIIDNSITGADISQLGSGNDLGGTSTTGASQDNCLVGEVKLFAGTFAPRGYLAAEGQLLLISVTENQPLFAVIGTKFGGDGRTNFAVPDLRDVEPTGVFGGGR